LEAVSRPIYVRNNAYNGALIASVVVSSPDVRRYTSNGNNIVIIIAIIINCVI